MVREKILIVDDDVDFVEIYKNTLERDGYQVSVAYNGKEGIKQVKSTIPDCIICDMMMETWSEGLTVVKTLRRSRETRNIPILFISAVNMKSPLGDISDMEDFLQVDRYLIKPFTPEKLLEQVNEVLRNKEAHVHE